MLTVFVLKREFELQERQKDGYTTEPLLSFTVRKHFSSLTLLSLNNKITVYRMWTRQVVRKTCLTLVQQMNRNSVYLLLPFKIKHSFTCYICLLKCVCAVQHPLLNWSVSLSAAVTSEFCFAKSKPQIFQM